jgi:hypothetical protein
LGNPVRLVSFELDDGIFCKSGLICLLSFRERRVAED